MRLFVALSPPAGWLQGLRAVQDGLRDEIPGDALRWVRPEGIHLTLKFLGEVPGPSLAGIEAALALAAGRGRALVLRAGSLGSFGGPRRLRVVWLGLAGELERIAALAAAVDRHLVAAGMAAETRPFRAHLTLARVRERAAGPALQRIHAALARAQVPPLEPWAVRDLALIRSHLGSQGARYEPLGRWPLPVS